MDNIPLLTVIGAAAIDSINPCAIGVLVFLLTFLFSMKGKLGKIMAIGLTYIIIVYISYFAAGIGLMRVLADFPFLHFLYKITAFILIVGGLIDIKDALLKSKKPLLAIPKSVSPIIKKYIYRASIPAAIVLGVMVSLFELPCTGGVYIAILSMISKHGFTGDGIWLLALYNLIFVLPLIIILALVSAGFSSAKVDTWRKSNKQTMRMIIGLAMIALAILMLSDVI
jgi:cytochrome c biogenesis protein CcdA